MHEIGSTNNSSWSLSINNKVFNFKNFNWYSLSLQLSIKLREVVKHSREKDLMFFFKKKDKVFFVEKNRDTFYLEHKLDTLYHWFYFFEGLITSITNSEMVVDRKYFSLDKMITNSPYGSSVITCLYWNNFDNNHFIVSYLYNMFVNTIYTCL